MSATVNPINMSRNAPVCPDICNSGRTEQGQERVPDETRVSSFVQAWKRKKDASLLRRWKPGQLKAFSQDTTLHGLKQVAESKWTRKFASLNSTFIGRFAQLHQNFRFFWIAVLLGATALMCFQLVAQFENFVSKPISINVFTELLPSLPFPAVAICNNNQFRYVSNLCEPFFVPPLQWAPGSRC